MADQVLRDNRGLVVGRIREKGGWLVAYNSQGLKVGSYDPSTDHTYDSQGLRFGQGNLLAALIFKR